MSQDGKVSLTGETVAAVPEAPANVLSSKTYLDLNLASHHFGAKGNAIHQVGKKGESRAYNEQNLGIGVTHMREVWQSTGGDLSASLGASVGYYRNSLYKDSFYVTANAEANYKLTPTVSVGLGAQVGAVTGYHKDVIPAGQIYARIEKEFEREMNGVRSVFAQFGVIPSVTADKVSTPATATVRVGISF